MSALFSTLDGGRLKLDNRIVISPMCQYSSVDGLANDWHMIHLGSLALSGAGLLLLEATAVDPRGRISYGDLGLYNDATEAAIANVVAAIRRYSPIRVGIQLSHAGRKASSSKPWEGGKHIPSTEPNGWETIAPSALPFLHGTEPPVAATLADIDHIVKQFSIAAARADSSGMDCVEIHAAHGYLVHQFLSPIANQRTDEYGGSLENRMRFPLRVFDAVRAATPSAKAVGVRISATDWAEGGWDMEQSIVFAKALDARGCDFIDVSTGGLTPAQQIPLGPGYQVPFAAAIKKVVSMPVMTVGLITEPVQAEEIIANGSADCVSLARAMLYDPHWPWHAAAQLGATIDVPVQYERCEPRSARGTFRKR